MASIMTGKRKREESLKPSNPSKKTAVNTGTRGKKTSTSSYPNRNGPHASQKSIPTGVIDANTNGETRDRPVYVQIVTGSYERVLHGISASIPPSVLEPRTTTPDDTQDATTDNTNRDTQDATPNPTNNTTFTDSFLFAAHASSIRCLALSPPTESNKCLLATGSSDERINLYSLSTLPPDPSTQPKLPSLTNTATAENPLNRSLGSLIHHSRALTCLHFPGKSKLFSAAEDATIAIARTRDWTVLSSIKAPIPKPQGRPSGDTAGPGDIPAGINDFAIHPSQKLMLSVGRSERCMRLWNLMTGKKAGVLSFERDLLVRVGEGKFSSGEGRQVLWDSAGENFVVGFERGAAVFGIDSKPRAVVRPAPNTKIHRMRFLPGLEGLLAFATEDGRILFFDVAAGDGQQEGKGEKLPSCKCVAQLGGPAAGISGRVKDFEVLALPQGVLLFVAASSDGAIRLWSVRGDELKLKVDPDAEGEIETTRQVGELVATHETGERITCVGAFLLDGKVSNGAADADDAAFEGFDGSEQEDGAAGENGE